MSDITKLPEISFCETDTRIVEAEVIAKYESLSGRSLAAGDPVRLFLESVAAIITQQRVLIDFAAKQNLLAYSSGDYLDHLGILLGVYRLEASAAKTTLRFTLSAPQEREVVIPQGTRATPNGTLFFATSAPAIVLAGNISIDVMAECMEVGSVGNGYIPGQIKKLVDPIPYIESVVNIAETMGGKEQEEDESLRNRIRLAPETFSTAGPYKAYEYWALAAHQDISDVKVYSPVPGQVNICALMQDGELPSQEILSLIDESCSADDKRPLTDYVHIHAPEQIPYTINLTFFVKKSDATISAMIVDAVNQAIQEFILWQKTKLGRDINPSELVRRVIGAGAKRVEIIQPQFKTLNPYQVAKELAIIINYGGIEDD